jgi:dihydrofolate reductase
MISAIFAVDEAGGLGWKGAIPWPHNKDDMRWFKTLTQGQIVVMGKRSWESPDMPKPLPGRHNVVFTNQFFDNDLIEQIKGDVCEALRSLERSNKKQQIFVIGGANLILQSKPILDRVFLTRIPGEYLSDVKLDVKGFLSGMRLENTINLGSCIVEEYHNEAISSSTRTRTRTRKKQD